MPDSFAFSIYFSHAERDKIVVVSLCSDRSHLRDWSLGQCKFVNEEESKFRKCFKKISYSLY